MSAPVDARADWLALREWLIKTRADAQMYARLSPHQSGMGFEAQAEVLSSALDFMDERERQALR